MMADGAWVWGPGFAALFLLYFVAVIASLVMMIVAVVDIAKRPDWQWRLAGQEKVVWILLVVLINLLAIPSLIYWFKIRPKLIGVEQAAARGDLGPGFMTFGGWQPTPPSGWTAQWMSPPGWHPDPTGQDVYRWWDGYQWSEHTTSGQESVS